MWKRCVTGSFDYVDENDNAIFHIYDFPESGNGRVRGQVFYMEKYSELIFEDTMQMFILKAAIKARELGWDLNVAKVDLNPDLYSLPRYESNMFKEYYSDDKFETVKMANGDLKLKKKEGAKC